MEQDFSFEASHASNAKTLSLPPLQAETLRVRRRTNHKAKTRTKTHVRGLIQSGQALRRDTRRPEGYETRYVDKEKQHMQRLPPTWSTEATPTRIAIVVSFLLSVSTDAEWMPERGTSRGQSHWRTIAVRPSEGSRACFSSNVTLSIDAARRETLADLVDPGDHGIL